MSVTLKYLLIILILLSYYIKKQEVKIMEELFVSIGKYVATEIENVKDVLYVDRSLGCMFYIDTNDGKRYLLSLIEG